MATNDDLSVRAALAGEYGALPLLLLASGNKFEAGILFEGVDNTDTKQLVIDNETADSAFLTVEPTVQASGQVFVQRRKNPTIDTAGETADIINPKTDETVSSGAAVTTAGDGETGAISGGDLYPEVTAGSGSNAANASPGESGTTGVTDIIMPGDTLAIGASNESGSVQDVSIVVSFLTIPTDEFDSLRFNDP